MNMPVFVWNHPKKAAAMTASYVAAGLQGHLLVGVFPMVPVKNNDHGIGGDCAPHCPCIAFKHDCEPSCWDRFQQRIKQLIIPTLPPLRVLDNTPRIG